jgi:hypothetical protein
MSTTGTIRLQLTAGEIPEPLEHQFLDAAGVDLTGYVGRATWERDVDGATGEITGTVDAAEGKVTATMTAASCATAGVVDVRLWAGNGSQRLASPVWRLLLSDPPGTAPSI